MSRGCGRARAAGVVAAIAMLALGSACAHRSGAPAAGAPPLATRGAPADTGRERTIAPFPVPGDTSPTAVRDWRTLNQPKAGVTTIAPVPPPVVVAPPPASRSGDYLYVEELPEPIEKPGPVYPEAARRAGIRGVVSVNAHVQTDGSVGEVRVIRSIPELDRAAIDCAKKWRFKPALSAGRPVAVWVGIPIRFEP